MFGQIVACSGIVAARTSPGESGPGYGLRMATRVPASQFAVRFELPDWRILRHRIDAIFIASTYGAAADFVAAVARLAETANHHPDVTLRGSGHVRIVLSTHDVGGLSNADGSLATLISDAAAERGLVAKPTEVAWLDIAIDALDIDVVRPFWKALLDYRELAPEVPGGIVEDLVDPRGIGPGLWFQQMAAPRRERNRIHLDLRVPHDVAQQRIAAAVAAGGRLLSDAHARAFWVLTDPEGNEACICTWQDRD
jgi:4a-hydroxytetrahydrobiopterin dehydratase